MSSRGECDGGAGRPVRGGGAAGWFRRWAEGCLTMTRGERGFDNDDDDEEGIAEGGCGASFGLPCTKNPAF